jgi:hypothetical protein
MLANFGFASLASASSGPDSDLSVWSTQFQTSRRASAIRTPTHEEQNSRDPAELPVPASASLEREFGPVALASFCCSSSMAPATNTSRPSMVPLPDAYQSLASLNVNGSDPPPYAV